MNELEQKNNAFSLQVAAHSSIGLQNKAIRSCGLAERGRFELVVLTQEKNAAALYQQGMTVLGIEKLPDLPYRADVADREYEGESAVAAESYFRQSAEIGNGDAEVALAFLLIDRSNNISGVPAAELISEAMIWLKKAIGRGHLHAMACLAWMHGNGWSDFFEGYTRLDWELSNQLLHKAAESGYPEAQYWLGVNCQNGNGVEKSIEDACHWYRKAALQGHKEASYYLACLLMKEGRYRRLSPSGMDVAREATKWFEVATIGMENDFLPETFSGGAVCTALGVMYLSDKWGIRDIGLAAKWFEKGKEYGDVVSACFLGYMHERGNGFPANFEEAKICYSAVPRNEAIILGLLGDDIRKRPDPLPRWFINFLVTMAWCEKNDEIGYCFDEYHYWENRVQPYIDRFEQEGNGDVLKRLGDLYFGGTLLKRNCLHARKLYIRSAEKGNNDASMKIEEIDAHKQAIAEMMVDEAIEMESSGNGANWVRDRSHIGEFYDWSQKTSLTVGDLTQVTRLEYAAITWSKSGCDGSDALQEFLAKHGLSFMSVSADVQLQRLRDMKLLLNNIPFLANGLPDIPRLLTESIRLLPFSYEASAVRLESAGISTIADLVNHNDSELLKLPNVGRRTWNDVRGVLSLCGLTLRRDPNLVTRDSVI